MKSALLASALVLVAGAASAGTFTEQFSNEIIPQSGAFSQNILLNTFDTSLGTLTGVTLRIRNNTTAAVSVFNSSTGPAGFTNATAKVPVTLTGLDGSMATALATAATGTGTANPGFNVFPGLTATNTTDTAVPSANFSVYETVGGVPETFVVSVSFGEFAGTGPTSLSFGGTELAGGTGTVIYTYFVQDVPEPVSLAVLGMGLVGVGIARRRSAR